MLHMEVAVVVVVGGAKVAPVGLIQLMAGAAVAQADIPQEPVVLQGVMAAAVAVRGKPPVIL